MSWPVPTGALHPDQLMCRPRSSPAELQSGLEVVRGTGTFGAATFASSFFAQRDTTDNVLVLFGDGWATRSCGLYGQPLTNHDAFEEILDTCTGGSYPDLDGVTVYQGGVGARDDGDPDALADDLISLYETFWPLTDASTDSVVAPPSALPDDRPGRGARQAARGTARGEPVGTPPPVAGGLGGRPCRGVEVPSRRRRSRDRTAPQESQRFPGRSRRDRRRTSRLLKPANEELPGVRTRPAISAAGGSPGSRREPQPGRRRFHRPRGTAAAIRGRDRVRRSGRRREHTRTGQQACRR